jgi:hypothetical protein
VDADGDGDGGVADAAATVLDVIAGVGDASLDAPR